MILDQLIPILSKISGEASRPLSTHRFATTMALVAALTAIAIVAMVLAPSSPTIAADAVQALVWIAGFALTGGTVHDAVARTASIKAQKEVAISHSQDLVRQQATGDIPPVVVVSTDLPRTQP